MKNRKEIDFSLYLVTDSELSMNRPLEWVVEEAVRGGVSMVQLREKKSETRDFLQLAKKLKSVLQRYHVPLLINDRIDIALAAGADGVHIGQSDMPYSDARKLLGKDAIIGLSVETPEQLQQANTYDLDYIGMSPVFLTPTKSELTRALGIDGVRAMTKSSVHPCVGIGGINKNNAGDVINAGADGIAVVSAICSARDPRVASRELLKIVREANLNA